MSISKDRFLSYVRNFIFGAEDSLSRQLGSLRVLRHQAAVKEEIIVTGGVLIAVEAFSMGVGSYVSERSPIDTETRTEERKTVMGGLIMFLSYVLAGLIPLAPYLFLDTQLAFYVSISATLISLFLLGVISARIVNKTHVLKNSFRMLLLGGFASFLGIIVGIAIS